jgi:DNA (cytosine-5)-methyltransferase 1
MKLRTLDLFSGIGGFSLGLESTGFFETIGFVEKDKFCQKVLKKHWSNINIEEDIRNVKGEKYQADVVTGGFPCQPFSVAGKRKSTADDRYLWDEMLRVIREVKPSWIIAENVEGIVNINEGMVLRQVLNDLENEGFKSQCIIIPASGIGAWHQRKRIWIVGANVENSNSRGRCWEKGTGKNDNIGSTTKKQNSNTESSDERCRSWDNKISINVPNSSSQRSSSQSIGEHRELDKEIKRKKETRDQSTLRTSSSCSDVPNTNTGFSIRENEEIQSRGNATTNGSEDVSNSNSWLRGGRGTELKSGDDREGWIYTEKEKQTREHIRCKTIGCNAVLGKDVLNTNDKRCEEFNILSEPEREIINHRGSDESKPNKTWWQIESEICGVPNGVSYELDKDRSNRIKSLGNSIVPQIARQIGLSIMEAELGN